MTLYGSHVHGDPIREPEGWRIKCHTCYDVIVAARTKREAIAALGLGCDRAILSGRIANLARLARDLERSGDWQTRYFVRAEISNLSALGAERDNPAMLAASFAL